MKTTGATLTLGLTASFLATLLSLSASAADCTDAAKAINASLAGQEACTTIVRLDYSTRDIKGYSTVCGQLHPTDGASALKLFSGRYSEDNRISLPNSSTFHSFYQAPSDFGSISIASARTGLVVFDGGIVWMGTGRVSTPKAWNTAEAAASGCNNSSFARPPFERITERNGGAVSLNQNELDAIDQVWQTAIPAGLSAGHVIQDAGVYLYGPTQGMFDPEVAEYLVMINSVDASIAPSLPAPPAATLPTAPQPIERHTDILGGWSGPLVSFASGRAPLPENCDLNFDLKNRTLSISDPKRCTSFSEKYVARAGSLGFTTTNYVGSYDDESISVSIPAGDGDEAVAIEIELKMISPNEAEYRESMCSKATPSTCIRVYGILTRK